MRLLYRDCKRCRGRAGRGRNTGGTTVLAMITDAGLTCCSRCGDGRNLVEDDGPPVCRRCIYAWGWYAGRLTGSSMAAAYEASQVELIHREHHLVPVVSCAFCRIRGAARRAS